MSVLEGLKMRVIRRRSFWAPIATSRKETGSTLVEYAIVLTGFLMLVLGIIDFSRALYTYHYVSAAARDATRWASVNGSTCNNDSSCNGTAGMNSGPASTTDIQNYVTSHLAPAIDSKKLTTNVNFLSSNGPKNCGNLPGCTVQVQVSYAFNFVVPLVHRNTLTLSSTSEMIIVH